MFRPSNKQRWNDRKWIEESGKTRKEMYKSSEICKKRLLIDKQTLMLYVPEEPMNKMSGNTG